MRDEQSRDIEAEVNALGLRPIAGADDGVVAVADPVDPPAVDPSPGAPAGDAASPPEPLAASPPPQPAAEELRELRDRLARAEGELSVLRSQPKPETPKPVQRVTREQVEQAFTNGQITDAQRIEHIADIRYQERRDAERFEEAREAPERAAEEDIAPYIKKYPDLADPNSELIGLVKAELARRQRRYGDNPASKLAQLHAVEAVVGGHHLGGNGVETNREFTRRRQTLGGGGGPVTTETTSKPKSRGEQLWSQLTQDGQDSFIHIRGSKDAAIKTLEHATDESVALMRKAGRFR